MSNRRWSALVVTVLAGLGVMVFAPPCRAAVPLTDDEAAAVEGAMWWQDNCKCHRGEKGCSDGPCEAAPEKPLQCRKRVGFEHWYCVRGTSVFHPCAEAANCSDANPTDVVVCAYNYYAKREGEGCETQCDRGFTSQTPTGTARGCNH